MDAYTIVFVFIFLARIECTSSDFWPNVGTVLFSRNDLHRGTLERNRLALLQARHHFQTLIPKADCVELDQEYVPTMLSYFRNAYICIKRESPDAEVDKIMTTALSDTVGGYMKLYMLPITKIYFYGGMVSFVDATRVHKFYDEVKRYLSTDGIGWREPDQNILNSIAIHSPRLTRGKDRGKSNRKCSKNPCNNFAYLEKTDAGLKIPVPSINWEDSTMFLPFKNATTFSLESPKHANTLKNYYNNAKCCVQSMGPETENKFDDKFQNWLSVDVEPHLNDDRLYAVLGSILNLVNRTKSMCDTIIDIYEQTDTLVPKHYCLLQRIFSSKSATFITFILLLEFIWCICAFTHMFFKKHNLHAIVKIGRGSSSKGSGSSCCIGTCDEQVGVNMNKHIQQIYPRGSVQGIKFSNTARSQNSTVGSQFPSKIPVALATGGILTHSNTDSLNNLLNESISVSMKSTVAYIPAIAPENIHSSQLAMKHSEAHGELALQPSSKQICNPNTYITSKEMCQLAPKSKGSRQIKKTETYTYCRHSHGNIDRNIHPLEGYNHKKSKLKFKILGSSGLSLPHNENTNNCYPTGAIPYINYKADLNRESHMIAGSYSQKGSKSEKLQLLTDVATSMPLAEEIFLNTVDEETRIQLKNLQQSETFHMQKDILAKEHNSHTRSRKPYVEIQIEKPSNAEIKLGITGYKTEIEKKKICSKIPKKAFKIKELAPEDTNTTAVNLIRLEQMSEIRPDVKDAGISNTAINNTVDAGTSNSNTIIKSNVKFNTRKHSSEAIIINTDIKKDKSLSSPRKSHGILKNNNKKKTKLCECLDKSPRVMRIAALSKAGESLFKKIDKLEVDNLKPSSPIFKNKSFIPKLRKANADDDAVVVNKNNMKLDNRLNVTL